MTYEILQNLMKSRGISWNRMEAYGIVWKLMKHHKCKE